MKLALAQMQMTPNLDENYQKSLDYLREAKRNKMKPYTSLRRPEMYE